MPPFNMSAAIARFARRASGDRLRIVGNHVVSLIGISTTLIGEPSLADSSNTFNVPPPTG